MKLGFLSPVYQKTSKPAIDNLPEIFSKNGQKKEQDTQKLIASLYHKIGQLEVELDWLKKNLRCCVKKRRKLIDQGNMDLSIARQCALLGLSRSSYYYEPAEENPYNLYLMGLIDKKYTKVPHYGTSDDSLAKERGP